MVNSLIYILKYIFVLPHLIVYMFLDPSKKAAIKEDVNEMNRRCNIHKNLAYHLIIMRPYRNLFYYRIGKYSRICKLFLPQYKLFYISPSIEEIGGGAFVLNHPFGSILNCKRIGRNFTVCQLTTLGNKVHGRNDLIPSIGDNVSLGANVTIIGNVTIGNNVIIGAGSVVVKDVPDNCVIVGNPAKVVKYL